MELSQKQIQHFHLRTGFGETPETISERLQWSKDELVNNLFEKSRKIQPIRILPNPIKNNKEITNFRVLKMILKSKKKTLEVNLDWIKQLANSDAQLREKMTFFWHDHFATKIPFAYLMQVQNNTLRKHALGSFREMLHAISKDPAMLIFLNNQQNKKRNPNENFAREVMELFTLGEGHYTEMDIKESARAFTGWQVNRLGEFEIKEKQHDNGIKTIFGQTGNFGGEDVINMLLDNRQTAVNISRKLYRFLVNPNENEAFIQEMADEFFNTNYSIQALLEFVLKSDHFYEEENIGSKIASPTELLVRYLRVFKLQFRKDRIILGGQKALSQVLLFPPNVAGWSEHRQWIDSSSLLYRMRLPLIMFGDYEMNFQAKKDLDGMTTMSKGERAALRWYRPDADWSGILNVIDETDKNVLVSMILDAFIQAPQQSINKDLLLQFMDHHTKETRVKSLAMHVMALPEFQLI